MSLQWARVGELLDKAVLSGTMPSAALAVGRECGLLFERYVGSYSEARSEFVGTDTVYDLSSLTKPLVTTALAMRLCEQGALDISDHVSRYFPAFAAADARRETVTLRDLLTHSSGLPAHRKYFLQLEEEQLTTGVALLGTRVGALRLTALAAAEPLELPPRTAARYSDVGFILLGRAVEIAGGDRLDAMFAKQLAGPLGLDSIGFIDLEGPATRLAQAAAPCGRCAWRGRSIIGEVQDENAWAMGGVAGHAGLFGSLRAVHRLVAEHVRAWKGGSSVFSRDVLRAFWRKDDAVSGTTWALGWDTPSESDSSAGVCIGHPAFGHLGFTGTSVWVDLERGVHVVLLTNRIEAGGDNAAIRALRPRLHDAVFEALG